MVCICFTIWWVYGEYMLPITFGNWGGGKDNFWRMKLQWWQQCWWYSRRESNPDQRFRKPLFYPLNYRSRCKLYSLRLISITS